MQTISPIHNPSTERIPLRRSMTALQILHVLLQVDDMGGGVKMVPVKWDECSSLPIGPSESKLISQIDVYKSPVNYFLLPCI